MRWRNELGAHSHKNANHPAIDKKSHLIADLKNESIATVVKELFEHRETGIRQRYLNPTSIFPKRGSRGHSSKFLLIRQPSLWKRDLHQQPQQRPSIESAP